jgi:hypothetical protein
LEGGFAADPSKGLGYQHSPLWKLVWRLVQKTHPSRNGALAQREDVRLHLKIPPEVVEAAHELLDLLIA